MRKVRLLLERALNRTFDGGRAVPTGFRKMALHDKLGSLRESRNIPDSLFSVAHQLRLVGNVASHDTDHPLPPRGQLLDLVASLKQEMILCSRSRVQR